ncbi:MAG TPA: PKD domain-containing protein [Candidatus Saccharimonadales bacterium]|nr:PKD domain-containing protein [Candidatus Saccharimonadales bacterium]
MATLKYNTADGGTNATAVTVGNSGGASGDAWGNVTGGANVWTYSSAQTVKGGLAYRCDQAVGAAAALQMDFTSGQATHYGRCYIYLTALNANEHPLVRAYVPGFANEAWRIAISSGSQLRIRDAAAVTLGTSTETLSANTWYRIEWKVVAGTGTSGQITVRVYSGDLTTPLITYTNNACNTGVSTGHIHFGNSLSAPTAATMYFDEITTNDAVYPGPANVVNQPPTAQAGPDQTVIEGSTVTLNGSGSNDSDGTISSYTWLQTGGASVTLSSNSSPTPTFTAPVAGNTLTFQLTVTDNTGATASDSVTVSVSSTLLRFNKAEGGSNSTVVTAANSGGLSGDPWVNVSGSNVWTYTTTNVARGTLAYQCTQGVGEAATLLWDLPAITEIYGRCYYYFTGFAAATQIVLRTFSGGFVNEAWRLDLQTDGTLRLRDGATDILGVASQPLQPGVWYRVEWHAKSGTSDGILEFKVFTADQSTPLFSYTNTACNMNSSMDHVQFGPGASNAQLPTMYADELALSEDSWIGTAPGTALNAPPTAYAGNDQNAGTGTAVTLDGSGSSDADGSIASYAWTQLSGTAVTLTGGTTAKPTFTAPGTAATLVFRLTVTDDDGATGTDTVTINVLASIIMQNSAAGGTSGGAVTVGNSGGASGNAWQTVNGGSAWTYTNARTARGIMGYQCDMATMTAAVLQWQLPTLAEHYGRVYFNWTGFGVAADAIVRLWATGFSEAFRVEVNTAQHVVMRDFSGSRFTSANALAANTWYRLEWHAVSSTTVGQLELRLYIADQTTPIETFTSAATLNIRAETSWIQVGPSLASTMNPGAPRKYFDEIVIGSAAGGWIGKAAGQEINQAPTANAGADIALEPHETYYLQGSATDDGTIANWSWRQISGTAVTLSSTTTQSPSFTVPAIIGGDTLVFGLTVTDDRGGVSAEDTVTITALTPTVLFARNGAWHG